MKIDGLPAGFTSLIRKNKKERKESMRVSGNSSEKVKKVVLAYSGGLDTSIIIPWLRENYGCEVIAMVGDVGQGDDYKALRAKALKSGASQVFVEDLREEFITDYLWKALQAGAISA